LRKWECRKEKWKAKGEKVKREGMKFWWERNRKREGEK
jgi:hypothetical protein